ncbi:hypothetical protein H632_c2048p0, partial [Helicosporidium sp. ATCC 50920]
MPPPSILRPPGGTVFLSNLQWWTTDAEIEARCAPHGTVMAVRFVEDKASAKSRGMVNVDFEEPEAVARAVSALNGADID